MKKELIKLYWKNYIYLMWLNVLKETHKLYDQYALNQNDICELHINNINFNITLTIKLNK